MSRKLGFDPVAAPAISRRAFLHIAASAATATGLLPRTAAAQETVVFYTAAAVGSADDLVKQFKQKTGMGAEYFRGGSFTIVQKIEQEVKAGQVRCGVMSLALPNLVAQWADKGLIMRYESPEHARYPKAYSVPGFAGPISAEPMAMAYNTKMLKEEEIPKRWEDLLDPKWKGRMTMSDAASSGGALHWYAAMRKTYGKSYLEKLSKQNVLIRTGGGDVVNTLIAGERPLAAMLPQYHALGQIAKGAPLKIITPDEGLPINYSQIFIPARSSNPEGAKKFVDFTLGREAQQFLQDKYFQVSLRDDVKPFSRESGAKPVNEVTPIASTPDDMEKFFAEQDMLTEEWRTLFK
jgi:iron(III) transport system substrate-binding protein